MTMPTRTSIRSEEGFALVFVLLALLVVSGLGAAMVASGRTEVLVSVNQERAAQARAAAEAGLNHGISLAIDYVGNWQSNGFANSSAAMTALLRGPDGDAGTTADNGSLAALPGGIPAPPARVVLVAAAGTAYETFVMDEDHPLRGLVAADQTRVGETGDATTDTNTRMVVRSTGYAGGGTVTVLEAIIGPIILPAIVTNDNLTISGSPTIGGSNGSVHSNTNLVISGNPTITENATATGTYTASGSPNVGGQSGGGRTILPIPPVVVGDHRPLADFILESDGRMTLQDGTVVCNASVTNDACKTLGYGWVYSPSGGSLGLPQWDITSNTAPNANATFYVEGDARISGSPGTALMPLAISIVAEGDIEISGNPNLRPDLPEVMLVSHGDLKISGVLEQPIAFEGQMLVREQLHISGNPTLAGQILVENVPSVSNLVLSNSISGNPTIVHNGIVSTNAFQVTGWREIR